MKSSYSFEDLGTDGQNIFRFSPMNSKTNLKKIFPLACRACQEDSIDI